MSNISFNIILFVLLFTSCSSFPEFKEGANNKVVVNASNGSHIINITSNNTEIVIHDSIDVDNLLFLREGKGITSTKGRIPLFLKGKKKLKLQFLVKDVVF